MLFYKARHLIQGETSSGSAMASQDFVPFRAMEENSVYEDQRHLFTIKIQKVCKSRSRLYPLLHLTVFPRLCSLALELAYVMVVHGILPYICKLFWLFPIARLYFL